MFEEQSASWLNANRKNTIRRLAKRYDYERIDNGDVTLDWKCLGLFRRNRCMLRHQIRRIEKTRAIYAQDYGYQLKSGIPPVWQTVIVCDAFARNTPEFLLQSRSSRPDQRPHAHALSVGSEYRLTGVNRLMLMHVFDASLQRFLNNNPGWTIQGADRYVVFYRPGFLVVSRSMIDYMRDAAEVFLMIDRGLAAWDNYSLQHEACEIAPAGQVA